MFTKTTAVLTLCLCLAFSDGRPVTMEDGPWAERQGFAVDVESAKPTSYALQPTEYLTEATVESDPSSSTALEPTVGGDMENGCGSMVDCIVVVNSCSKEVRVAARYVPLWRSDWKMKHWMTFEPGERAYIFSTRKRYAYLHAHVTGETTPIGGLEAKFSWVIEGKSYDFVKMTWGGSWYGQTVRHTLKC